MRRTWPFGRHQRWRENVDAFLDGELNGEQARRFEAHVTSCAECSALAAQRTEVKRLTMALPDVRAARAFQLTRGMLVEPARVRVQRGAPVVARVAQVTAGLAAFAFAAVLFADLSTNGGGGNATLQSTAGDDDDAGLAPAGEDAAGSAPVERNSASSGQGASSTQQPPEVGGSVGAASNPSTTPQPPATDSSSYFGSPTEEPVIDDSLKISSEPGAAAPAALGDAAVIGQVEDKDDSSRWRLTEASLAVVAGASLVTWIITRRRA